jgi:uncharacterized protein (DUF2236 family)
MHDGIKGTTPSGEAYRANDPELLTWVHATATFGFLQAYEAYVRPLSQSERDRYYAETVPAGRLYGATQIPTSQSELDALFHAAAGRLERSGIILEFLALMRRAPVLPLPLRPAQHVLVRAAVDLTPHWVRTILGIEELRLRAWEAALIRQAGAFADRVVLESSPAVAACRRLGLPADYLYQT